jgi:hypothetical protein
LVLEESMSLITTALGLQTGIAAGNDCSSSKLFLFRVWLFNCNHAEGEKGPWFDQPLPQTLQMQSPPSEEKEHHFKLNQVQPISTTLCSKEDIDNCRIACRLEEVTDHLKRFFPTSSIAPEADHVL